MEEPFNTRAMWYYHDTSSTAHHYLLEIKRRVSTKSDIPVLIPEVNKIFSSIALLTDVLSSPEIANSGQENEDISQVYLRFESSNFLYEELKAIAQYKEVLDICFPSAWQNATVEYYSTFTGNTMQQTDIPTGIPPTLEYKYTHDSTGFILSGTPYINGGYLCTYAEIEMSLTGKGFSGATLYCSSSKPYLFNALQEGSYTLVAYSEAEKCKYMSVDILMITGNTSCNPTLNLM